MEACQGSVACCWGVADVWLDGAILEGWLQLLYASGPVLPPLAQPSTWPLAAVPPSQLLGVARGGQGQLL